MVGVSACHIILLYFLTCVHWNGFCSVSVCSCFILTQKRITYFYGLFVRNPSIMIICSQKKSGYKPFPNVRSKYSIYKLLRRTRKYPSELKHYFKMILKTQLYTDIPYVYFLNVTLASNWLFVNIFVLLTHFLQYSPSPGQGNYICNKWQYYYIT